MPLPATPETITYHVVRTISPEGDRLTHIPARDRIVSSFEWSYPGNRWGYVNALACADEIRNDGKGYAIVVADDELSLY